MNSKILLIFFLLTVANISLADEESPRVSISADLAYVDVMHKGKPVRIERNQDKTNTVNPNYAKTSRSCPPFCIQPIKLNNNVETLGELEVLDYLQRQHSGDNSILLIDSRTPDWVNNGTIPGSINLPWKQLTPSAGADPFIISDILQNKFNVKEREGLWDFSEAKTLILFCNGMWCGQSPSNIKSLLRFGYPASKLKWYRGGMQNWENLGLTVIK